MALSIPLQYDAFIAHSEKDEQFKDILVEYLNANSIKCCYYQEHFTPGKPLPLLIYENMTKSRKIIFIISKAYLKSKWIQFEKAQAEQISQSTGKKSIIYVLYGGMKGEHKPDREEIPHHFQNTSYLEYPDRCENERFFKKILFQINENIDLKSSFPVGNIAHGFAWSYFFGYLNLILPGLKNRIQNSKYAKEENDEILYRFVIILPEDWRSLGSLEEVGFHLEGQIPFKATRAGITRDYKHTVYSIQDQNKKLFFLGELATPLQSLYDMGESTVTGVNDDYKDQQTKIFMDLLKEILEWSKWRDSFLLIKYKWNMSENVEEGKIPFVQFLLDSIQNEIEKDKQLKHMKDVTFSMKQISLGEDATTYDVYVACCYKDKEVIKFSESLIHDLRSKGKKCISDDEHQPGKPTIDAICGNIARSQRVVLLISRELEDTCEGLNSEWFQIAGYETIVTSIMKQRKMIIPVLFGGIDPDKVPYYVRDVTYIEVPKDPHYLQKIINGIDDDATLTSMIPAGNVAEGLAWTYYLGFLQFVLQDILFTSGKDNLGLGDRICQYEDGGIVFKKIIFIMSKNCFHPKSPADEDNCLKLEEKLTKRKTRAGNVNRSFSTSLYSILDQETQTRYFFVAELPPPLLALYEMSESRLAGLTEQQRDVQRDLFIGRLEMILDSSYDNKYKFLDHDWDNKDAEGKSTLSTNLLALIKKDLALEASKS